MISFLSIKSAFVVLETQGTWYGHKTPIVLWCYIEIEQSIIPQRARIWSFFGIIYWCTPLKKVLWKYKKKKKLNYLFLSLEFSIFLLEAASVNCWTLKLKLKWIKLSIPTFNKKGGLHQIDSWCCWYKSPCHNFNFGDGLAISNVGQRICQWEKVYLCKLIDSFM